MSLATRQPLSIFSGIAPSTYDDSAFDKVVSSGSYLPRLHQFTDKSVPVMKKEIVAGFYLISSKDDKVLLGDDVEVVPVAWGFKALDTSGPKPVSSSDPESDLFKAIAARAARAGGPNSKCQAGIEFLLWVPAAEKFATYLMANQTAAREAKKMRPLMFGPVTIKTHVYENDKGIWQGPKVYESSVPPTALPTPEALAGTVEKFKNPTVEAAPEPVAVENKRAR